MISDAAGNVHVTGHAGQPPDGWVYLDLPIRTVPFRLVRAISFCADWWLAEPGHSSCAVARNSHMMTLCVQDCLSEGFSKAYVFCVARVIVFKRSYHQSPARVARFRAKSAG